MHTDFDAYVIHAGNPCRPESKPTLIANSDVTFRLQKYHYKRKKQIYQPVFRREVPLNLHIDRLLDEHSKNRDLPVLFDGCPRPPLPERLAIDSRKDLILRSLSPELRLVFRYDPERDVGVLVHFGYDFAALDTTPLLQLWLTADKTAQEELLTDIASRITP